MVASWRRVNRHNGGGEGAAHAVAKELQSTIATFVNLLIDVFKKSNKQVSTNENLLNVECRVFYWIGIDIIC